MFYVEVEQDGECRETAEGSSDIHASIAAAREMAARTGRQTLVRDWATGAIEWPPSKTCVPTVEQLRCKQTTQEPLAAPAKNERL